MLQDSDRPAAKGCQIKIKEGGVGEELSQTLSNVALGANILNHLLRSWGPRVKTIAGQLTLGRLLIVGDKGLALQKSIAAQKAEYEATGNIPPKHRQRSK